jgi:MFS family permease
MLVVSLDSAVNVALPAMAKAFAIGPAEIRWVIICYVLTYAITSVAAGVVADRLGPVPVYTVGMWLSVVAFLLYFLVTEYPLARHAGAPGAGRWPRLRHITGAGHALAASRAAWPGPRHARGWPGGGRDRRAARRWRHRGLGLAVGLWLPGAAGAGRRSPGALLLPRTAGAGVWRLPPRREWMAWPVMQGLTLAALASWAQFSVWLLAPFYLVSLRGLSPPAGCFSCSRRSGRPWADRWPAG